MLSINEKIIAFLAAALFAVVAGLGIYGHGKKAGAEAVRLRYEAALGQQKAQAAAELAAETAKTRSAERLAEEALAEQERKDATNEKQVSDLRDRLRAAAGPAGQLRDPFAPGCRGGSDSAAAPGGAAPADRRADGAEAGGLLSAELSGLLERLLSEADEINIAYSSCRAQLLRRSAGP